MIRSYFKRALLVYLLIGLFIASPALLDQKYAPLILVAIFSTKYIVYEIIVLGVLAKYKQATRNPWYWMGLCLAALVDMASVSWSLKEDADAGFAILALIGLTTWYLVGSVVLMILQIYIRRRKK